MILYSDFLLSMEDSVCFSIVDMERSKDHHLGCFRTEFKKLKENFESTSQDERCEIKLEYESMKMKSHEDPELFINTMEKLSRRMNEDFNMKILEEDIITKALNTLPRDYKSLVYSLQVQMVSEKGVTLDNIKEQLRLKYQRMKNPLDLFKGTRAVMPRADARERWKSRLIGWGSNS